jgi:hypothetical protein
MVGTLQNIAHGGRPEHPQGVPCFLPSKFPTGDADSRVSR